MSCKHIQELLPLYYYGELVPEQEEQVEAHCAECSGCGGEVELYRRFSGALDEAEMEPSLGLLAECREQLARNVIAWERPASQRWWKPFLALNLDFRVPVGAVALVAVGWFSAKLLPEARFGAGALSQGAFSQSASYQGSVTSLVRSVEPDASGRVQIAVDDIHRRVISGGREDRKIRALLLAAAREESSPGVRAESVECLKSMAGASDVRAALLDSVEHDPNPGVRLKALEGLKRFSQDAAVRKTLTAVLLNDSNAGVRIEVIDLLVAQRASPANRSGAHDDSVIGVMQGLARRENDTYVRGRLERALLAMNASAGTF